ncbi:copia protein [Tanacetum coccineum]
MLVIKRFSERKKVFRERKKTEKIRAKSENDVEDKTNDETCLMAQSSNESSSYQIITLVDDDVGEEAIEINTKVVNNNNEEDELIEVDEVVNIKETKNHPLEQVIFPLPMSQAVIGTKWVFRNKLDENGIVSRNKARLVAQGYNQQEGIDYDETYALFEMSMMGELNFFLGLQIKQMKDMIFFNQSKYIKEMLKKFGLEDSKPTKTPMSIEIKLNKDDEADSVDSTKYRGMIGSLL